MNKVVEKSPIVNVLEEFGIKNETIQRDIEQVLLQVRANQDCSSTESLCNRYPQYSNILKLLESVFLTTFTENSDYTLVCKSIENSMEGVFRATTGCKPTLISAICAEAYEGRDAQTMSISFIPEQSIAEASSHINFFNKDDRFSDDFGFRISDVRKIRKALEITKSANRDNQLSLVVSEGESKGPIMVGIGAFEALSASFPYVRFEGRAKWSFYLPGNNVAMFLCSSGRFQAPIAEDVEMALALKEIEERVLCSIIII